MKLKLFIVSLILICVYVAYLSACKSLGNSSRPDTQKIICNC